MNYRTHSIITPFLMANFNIQWTFFFKFCPYVGLGYRAAAGFSNPGGLAVMWWA